MIRIALTMAASAFLLAGAPADLDRDGIDDAVEQDLLVRFAPAFLVSAADCDSRPSAFDPGSLAPKVIARDGTVYGQVFRHSAADRPRIEIHYYHLWSRDCGRFGHALDGELVSALVEADRDDAPAAQWTARYWYAAAHQGTLCDAGHGARAPVLGAEERGPVIWISSGKHASYLSPERCARGCGGDRCEQMVPLATPSIVNIGEPGAYMNGAQWVASRQWPDPISNKMGATFSPATVAGLDSLGGLGIVALGGSPAPVKTAISAGNVTVDSTGKALATAGDHSSRAVETGTNHTGRALARARRVTGEWIRKRIP